eukprot:g3175.t1
MTGCCGCDRREAPSCCSKLFCGPCTVGNWDGACSVPAIIGYIMLGAAAVLNSLGGALGRTTVHVHGVGHVAAFTPRII